MHNLHYYTMLQYQDDFQAILFLGLPRLLNSTQVPFYVLLIYRMHNLHYCMMLQYQDDFQAILFLVLLRLLVCTQVPFYVLLIQHMQSLYYYIFQQYQDDLHVTLFLGFLIFSYNNRAIQDNMLIHLKQKLFSQHTLPKFHPRFLLKYLHY